MTQHLLIELERDENGFLHSVRPFPELLAPRVMAQVEAPEEPIEYDLSDPTQEEFDALQSLAFADWADLEEDIYAWEEEKSSTKSDVKEHDEK